MIVEGVLKLGSFALFLVFYALRSKSHLEHPLQSIFWFVFIM